MSFTSINDRPGRLPVFPNAANTPLHKVNSFGHVNSFNTLYQPIHNVSPVAVVRPNGFSNLQNDLSDPYGNQTQLAQLIQTIAQQFMQCFKLFGGNGFGGNGFGANPHPGAGFGIRPQFPNSFHGGGYEGGMHNFRPFPQGKADHIGDTRHWQKGPKDCCFGDCFRAAKRIDCDDDKKIKRDPKPEPKHEPRDCKLEPKRDNDRDCKVDDKRDHKPKRDNDRDCKADDKRDHKPKRDNDRDCKADDKRDHKPKRDDDRDCKADDKRDHKKKPEKSEGKDCK